MSAPAVSSSPALDPVVRSGVSVILVGPPAARDACLGRWVGGADRHTLGVSARSAPPWPGQVAVVVPDPAAGLTTSAAVRAFLRQDPDAIVCDAPPDEETWPLLVQAALTGHQVLVAREGLDLAGAAAPLLAACAGPLGGISPAHLGWLVVALDDAGAPAQVGWLAAEGVVCGWERGARRAAPLPQHLQGLEPAPAPATAAGSDGRRARRRRLRLVAAGIALLVGLAVGEVTARVSVLERVEPRDKDAWHAFDPQLGWWGQPGWSGQGQVPIEPPRTFAVRLNAQGLRMDREVAPTPPPGKRRVCLVGDSYTFGWGVEVEEACPARLEALLGPEAEVINLGVCAYGVDQMRLVVEQRALPLQPDVVVLAVIADDFRRALRAVANVGHRKPRFLLEGDGTPRLTGVPVPEPAPPGAWEREDEPPDGGSFLLWRLGALWERVQVALAGGAERARLRWRLGQALLLEAQRLCRARQVPLVVALFPMRKHLEDPAGDPVRPLLLELAPGLPVCDVYPAFAAAGPLDPLFIPVDGHPSPAGQALQAEALARFLREQGFWPAPR